MYSNIFSPAIVVCCPLVCFLPMSWSTDAWRFVRQRQLGDSAVHSPQLWTVAEAGGWPAWTLRESWPAGEWH